MKIAQVAGWYAPDSLGGTEIYVAALSRLAREAGHEVRVAAPSAGATSSARYEVDGIPVFRYPVPSAPTRDEAQGVVPVRGTERFREWLEDERPDVVHVHTFVTGLGLDELQAARARCSRLVVTTHSSSLGFLCQRGTLMHNGETICDGRVEVGRCATCALEHRGVPVPVAGLAARVPLALSRIAQGVPGRVATAVGMPALIGWNRERQRRMFDAIDRFVVLTERAASILRENGAPAAKVAVNRLGVSPAVSGAARRVRRAGAPVRVGYVGRYDAIKGVLDLAAAVRRLPADVPIEVEFRGPLTSEDAQAVVNQAQRLCGHSVRVTFGGAVAPGDVTATMASYDIACYPSRCLEGGPTAGLEAIAAGTPVIAAAVGGVAEILHDGVNGRLIAPGDLDALSDALVEVATKPAATIDRWRERLPRIRTMREVADDYLRLYDARS